MLTKALNFGNGGGPPKSPLSNNLSGSNNSLFSKEEKKTAQIPSLFGGMNLSDAMAKPQAPLIKGVIKDFNASNSSNEGNKSSVSENQQVLAAQIPPPKIEEKKEEKVTLPKADETPNKAEKKPELV